VSDDSGVERHGTDAAVVEIDPSAVQLLATADRNGVVETMHHGVAIALGVDGEVVASLGDPSVTIYPRSALKPFQTAAMLSLGLDLPDRLVALATASHAGARLHLDGVVEILSSVGLGLEALGNTPDRPLDPTEREASIVAGRSPSSLQQNCSGKHAAMLVTCRINGWPLDDYLDVEHPLQRAIVTTIDGLGASVRHIGIDGCGAPTHALELGEMAQALRRLALDDSPVLAAMSAYPEMVAGRTLDDTMWMQAVPGLAAKRGANGVMAIVRTDGRAAVLKVADGSDLARRVATVEALRHLGVDVDGEHRATTEQAAAPVLGHGAPVGTHRAAPWK
jgi:L-asparaginase II